MTIAHPTEVRELAALSAQLDNATHAQRLAWAYTLDEKAQLALYALAKGQPLDLDDVVGKDGAVMIHHGRNGMPIFNRFQKRFARLGNTVVGYNHNDTIGKPFFHPLMKRLIGPGHYTTYEAPDGDGLWIDYRMIPEQQHPEYPPLIDNEHGTRALVFGNMVDVLRRASRHVFIGNAYKDKSPARTLMARIGSRLPTAPFVLVQPE